MSEDCLCCEEHNAQALLAVCDVLVVKALEAMGKWIVRVDRSRWTAHGTQPFYTAHVRWRPEEEMVTKALRGAWDVVPAMLDSHGCCGVTSAQVTRMLDQYVHDLAITGTPHDLDQLHYRFRLHLGLDVLERQESHA